MKVSTLVIKNLALDFRKEDVERFLQGHGAAAAEALEETAHESS